MFDVIIPDNNYTMHAQSSIVATRSTAYTCQVDVYRTTTGTSDKSTYLFCLYITRNTTTNRATNKWSMRYVLDSYDTGIHSVNWPKSTTTLVGGIRTQVYAFTKELNNDGKQHTVVMCATCEEGAPKGCDITLTFNTFKAEVPVTNPTNVRWVTRNFAEDTIKVAWDSVTNADGYYIYLFKNAVRIGAVQTQDTEYSFKVSSLDLNPRDTIHIRVKAVSSTGNESDSIESPTLTYGDMANVKVDATWEHAQPCIKHQGNFKPVRTTWIKVDGIWTKAVDK